jgi:hypothetical protein
MEEERRREEKGRR